MRALLIALTLLITLSASAAPQDADLAKAKEHFRRGTQLYDLGQYLEAAIEYQAAFKLSDRVGFLFNIAQAYRLGGKPQDALSAYRGFLRREPSSPQSVEAQTYVVELTKLLDQQAADRKSQESQNMMLTRQGDPHAARKRVWLWPVVGGTAGVVVLGLGLGLGLGLSQKHEPSLGLVHLQ